MFAPPLSRRFRGRALLASDTSKVMKHSRRVSEAASLATGDGTASAAADLSAATAATSMLLKHVAPTKSPAHCSLLLGVSGGVSNRKNCYVIFEGTASQSLRAAFAKRPDWRDGSVASSRGSVSDEAKSRESERAAQNARCHEALQRGSGRGGVSFCWRHMPPKHPDTSSVVVNRWRARRRQDRTGDTQPLPDLASGAISHRAAGSSETVTQAQAQVEP